MVFSFAMKPVFIILLLPLTLFANDTHSSQSQNSPQASEKPSFEDKIQQEAKILNNELQPLQHKAQNLQRRLNELYGLENPTFYLYKTQLLTISLQPSVAYHEKSQNPFSPAVVVENQLSKQRYFSQPAWDNQTPGKVKELEYGADVFIQTQYHNQPWFRLSTNRIEARQNFINTNSSSENFRGDFSDINVGIGNEIPLSETLNLKNELTFGIRANTATDVDDKITPVNLHFSDWALNPSFSWKKSYGSFHFLPRIGYSIQTNESNSVVRQNSESVGFQWDIKPTTKAPSAKIFEVGVHRIEEIDSNNVSTNTRFQPYLSGHWKGLEDGSVDLDLGYQILIQKSVAGSNGDPEQVTAIPKWQVPLSWIKEKWKNLSELNSVEINTPTRFSFGGGQNHVLSTGVGATLEINIAKGVTLKPSFHIEYSLYYKEHKDQIGFHAGIGL